MDALIAAIVGRALNLGQTLPIQERHLGLAAREGLDLSA
jgi:hypothetical protein